MEKRVVVTGLGVISPVGNDINSMWDNIKNGVSGIGYITKYDTTDFKVKVAAEVKDFNPADYIAKKDIRTLDQVCHYAIAAAKQAKADAGITDENCDPNRVGSVIGTGVGGVQTFKKDLYTTFEKGYNKMPLRFIPMIIPNMPAGNVAIAVNAKGHCSATVTACAAGTHSIGDAYRIIARGDCDVMYAGGAEAAIEEAAVSGFTALTALSTSNDPSRASIPFDKERDGFVIGEGAGIIVLEELEHAKKRGAHIYAEIIGYGSTCDAFHTTAPDGFGAARAFELCLKDGGVEPSEVDYINAHGTSTPINDRMETQAIKSVFKEDAYKLAVSSTKSMTGHALGAAGGFEAIISIKAIEDNFLPPTIGHKVKDEECDLDIVANVGRSQEVNVAMSNSLGFGGHNAVIMFRKYGE